MLDTFIADLKDSVEEAKTTPSGKGTMVAVYGKQLSRFLHPSFLSSSVLFMVMAPSLLPFHFFS